MLAVLLWSTLLPGALRAEVLQGRIFLGPGLHLYLEKDEGLFTQMMRSLALMDGEIPIMDLSSLMIAPHQLFLGTDRGLYYRDESDGSIHKVGSFSSPREIHLTEGVTLLATRTAQEVFEGKTVDTLRVTIQDSELPPPVDGIERAGMAHWLGWLEETWVPGAMTEEESRDAALVQAALMGALPTDSEPTAAQGESLKILRGWLEANPYSEAPFLEQILDETVRGLKAQTIHGETDGPSSETLAGLLVVYEGMLDEVRSR